MSLANLDGCDPCSFSNWSFCSLFLYSSDSNTCFPKNSIKLHSSNFFWFPSCYYDFLTANMVVRFVSLPRLGSLYIKGLGLPYLPHPRCHLFRLKCMYFLHCHVLFVRRLLKNVYGKIAKRVIFINIFKFKYR